MENLSRPGRAVSVFGRIQSRNLADGLSPPGVRSEVLKISKALGPLGPDFLLLLVDEQLSLVDAWRLPREEGAGAQGFPVARAVGIALDARAAGMILIQERMTDLVPRRPDLELTEQLKRALGETAIELLDHFLLSKGSLAACRPR